MTDQDLPPDLEDIALDCLARLENEGDAVLDAFCERHPEHAARLRGMLTELRRIGLAPLPLIFYLQPTLNNER